MHFYAFLIKKTNNNKVNLTNLIKKLKKALKSINTKVLLPKLGFYYIKSNKYQQL